jgi:hypothetical protein
LGERRVAKNKFATSIMALILLSFASLRLSPSSEANLARATGIPDFPDSLITPFGDNATTVATRISVCPSSLLIPLGGNATVALAATNVTNLFAWQVVIEYNASLINCSAAWVAENNVFQGQTYVTVGPITGVAMDRLNYTVTGATLIAGETVNVSSGTLFEANFTGMQSGEAVIRIGTIANPVWENPTSRWYSFLADPDMNEMPFVEDNGLASVGSVNVTVVPTSGLGLTFANVTGAGSVTANKTSTVQAPPLVNLTGQYYDVRVTASYSGNVTVSLAFDGSNMTQQQKSSLRMMQYTPIPGDIAEPFGIVEMRDIGLVARHFGETVPPAPLQCDITGPAGVPDGVVDMRDIGLVARNFGKTAQWTDITTYVDTANNIIYGETTHFSLIGIH